MRRMSRLPLSWSVNDSFSSFDGSGFAPQSLWLPRIRRNWIYGALMNSDADLASALLQEAENIDVIVRGCLPDHKMQLGREGWFSRQSGIEALLIPGHPQHWQPHASLRELRRRALRKGEIEIIDGLSQEDINRLSLELRDLRNRSHYRLRPALNHLFQNHPGGWEQALIYRRDGKAEAMVGWSRNGKEARHLEVLLRSTVAPVGTMEALILESVDIARNQGISMMSLGEVPFLRLPKEPGLPNQFERNLDTPLQSPSRPPSKFPSYYLMRPAFSSMGLFKFKNKFRPVWAPLYLMSNKRIGVVALADLFFQSGCHRLLGYCLTHPRHS